MTAYIQYFIITMKYLEVDEHKCIGCGLCEEELPELFQIEDSIAVPRKGALSQEQVEKAEELALECPAEALRVKEKTGLTICNGSGTEQ